MRLRWILLLAAVILGAAALTGVAQPQSSGAAATSDPSARTITVTGNGSVTTVPDQASFDVSVAANALTATAAFAKIEASATAVTAAIKNAGVAAAGIQTSQVSLSPTTSDNGTIVGYASSLTVTVDTTLSRAGSVIDAAVGAGATGVDGPNLSPSDEETLYRTALADAVADATAKAKALATAGSLTLGSVQTIVEGSNATPVVFGAKADASSPLPLEPGTQTITATVTVTFAA